MTTTRLTHKKRVLVPLTLAGATEPKLTVVAQQARALNAHVTLLHVLHGTSPPAEEERPEREAEARTFLDGVAAHLRRGGVRAKGSVRYGAVASEVGDAAREHGASMVIVGASEPRGFGPLVLGGAGLAGAIAREAPCPVLVVRRGEPGSSTGERQAA